MKKITLLIVALAIGLVTFAQGTITYNLNGGVTNDYGWKNKAEIALDLQKDYNEAYNATKAWALDSLGVVYYNIGGVWMTEEAAQGQESTVAGFLQASTYNATDNLKNLVEVTKADKYSWLKDVIVANRVAQGLAADLSEALYRKELSAFFLASPATLGWPVSSSFETTAGYAAFAPIWKHGFCGPTEYAEGETVVLPTPYKEGESFLGWYKEADFSGEKVTTISGTGDVVLYAKFGEYIPTIAEVIALADGTATKVQGTITYAAGSNFWIQDATGGLLCYGRDNGLTEGELVTLSGEKVIYKGSPELNNATVVVKEAGSEVGAQTLLLAAILADANSYLNELVRLEGVTFSRYEDKGDYKTPYVTDGINEIALYNWNGVTEDKYPVGTKVSVKAVLSIYNTTLQLRGKEAWIEAAAAIGKDNYAYPEVEIDGTKFYLESEWMYSVNLGNWADNRPNPLAEGSRSVVEKDGILYFSYRDNNIPTERPKLVRVEAETGKMLDPVFFADYIFKDIKGDWLFGPFCDLKLDNAGNAVTSNLPTDGGAFQVWKVDIETGEGEVLIDLATDSAKFLINQFPDNTTIRLDRIGVYGDVNGDAIVMAAVASGTDVYYWYIEDGEWDGETNWLALAITEKHLDGTTAHFSYAPVVCPIEDDYFYVDGFSSYPILFDPDGNVADAFTEDYEADHLTIGLNGVARDHAKNGVTEFEVNGEYYLLIAGAKAPSTFVLYKFADEYRYFKDMTQMWEFPNAGMGSMSDQQRVATSFARPNEEGTAVDIYVFSAENGYGKYTMYIGEESEVIEPSIEQDEQSVFFENTQGWEGDIYAYLWKWDENNLIQYTGEWPGEKCTYLGNNVWKWTYTEEDVIEGGVIFTNYDYWQTADLVFVNGGYYTADGYLKTIYPEGFSVVVGNSSNYGVISGAGSYAEGDVATITAEAKLGYEFSYWEVYPEGEYAYNVYDRELTLNMNTNYTIYAHFEQIKVLVEGVYYYLNYNNYTAKVTSPEEGSYCDVVILDKITIESGEEFTVTTIDHLGNSDYLNKLVIPSSINYISYDVFYRIGGISKLYIEDIASWCNVIINDSDDTRNPFQKAEIVYINGVETTKLVIPEGVTSIESQLFYGSKFTSVELPSTLSYIGYDAFGNCNSLTTIKFNTSSPMGDSYGEVFGSGYCGRLIFVPCGMVSNYESVWGLSECYTITDVEYVLDLSTSHDYCYIEIQDGISCDDNEATLYAYSGMESLVFKQWSDGVVDNPRTVVVDRDTSFVAEFVEYYNIFVYSVDESKGTVSGGGKFLEYVLDTLVAIPEPGYVFDYWNVYYIDSYGDYIYYGAYFDNPMQIGVEGSYVFEAYFRIAPVLIDGVYYYLDTEWQNATVARSLEYSGDIVVPESVTYEGVEYWVNYIEDYAFYYRPITSLTIEPNICPNSEYTITGCDKLEVLKVGTCFLYNSNVYNVSSIFPNLRELHITSGYVEDLPEWWDLEVVDLSKAYNTELYANLFVNGDYMYAWDNLKRLVLPEGLDQIWPRQFEGLWLLEEIVIPENVTEIPDGAFYNCHALSSITLNKNLETIGNYAFYNCHALESLVLPEGVTEVGNAAFYGCAYLEELEMPATLKQVADNAFAFCSKVKIIKSKALEPPVLSEKTFYEVDRSIPVYVAEVSYDKYVNDQYWGEFFNIIPTSEYNEELTNVENTEKASFVVYTQKGVIYVEGVTTDYKVFDSTGKLIYTGRELTLSLPRGIYMISVGDEVQRVVL